MLQGIFPHEHRPSRNFIAILSIPEMGEIRFEMLRNNAGGEEE